MEAQENPQGAGTAERIAAEDAISEFESFIYLVSHDVRNSVRALVELPQWIEEDLDAAGYRLTESLSENIELMNTHTRRLDRMLIDLLVYSRIGRMQSGADISWDTALDTVLDQIQIPAEFQVIRDIRAPTIHIGETDVLTLLSSLITNAVKHHDRPDGCVRISTRAGEMGHVLSVTDDGPGIPLDARDKVFEVMTTLKPRDEIEGSGMGLANVRKIANFYRAEIEWLEPPDGRGCGLQLRFPASRPLTH